jgi:hypothetical protein
MIMKGVLKWPLIVAAVLVIARIVSEQAGAPNMVNNLFSVVVLYLIIAPLYFAFQIVKIHPAHPYKTLLKITALFTALARSMVIPTYWLAYLYQWPQARFSAAQGGVVGPGVTTIRAFVFIPMVAAAGWILASLIVGGGIGSIVIALKRKSTVKVAA